MSINPVTQYPGKVAPATPDNPFGTARNITIPGDGTGTPWESALLKDEWALHHAMLLNAGMTPNETPDSAENSQLFKAAKASVGNGANLLSNHNFLTSSPDTTGPGATQPPPDATPRSYPPGFQIFSDVFANETTGITGLTYINGRVSFSGGDFYIPRANSKELENITEFVASVADFDGKPRTRGVSFALVGDEYRVTVGVDALEDESANETLLGSVKFEQGSVATGHLVGANAKELSHTGDSQSGEGVIHPIDSTLLLPIGATPAGLQTVPSGVTRLRVDTGALSTGEELLLWEDSGDFGGQIQTITNTSANVFGGYDVVTAVQTYEFLPRSFYSNRKALKMEGWNVDLTGAVESSAQLVKALESGNIAPTVGRVLLNPVTPIVIDANRDKFFLGWARDSLKFITGIDDGSVIFELTGQWQSLQEISVNSSDGSPKQFVAAQLGNQTAATSCVRSKVDMKVANSNSTGLEVRGWLNDINYFSVLNSRGFKGRENNACQMTIRSENDEIGVDIEEIFGSTINHLTLERVNPQVTTTASRVDDYSGLFIGSIYTEGATWNHSALEFGQSIEGKTVNIGAAHITGTTLDNSHMVSFLAGDSVVGNFDVYTGTYPAVINFSGGVKHVANSGVGNWSVNTPNKNKQFSQDNSKSVMVHEVQGDIFCDHFMATYPNRVEASVTTTEENGNLRSGNRGIRITATAATNQNQLILEQRVNRFDQLTKLAGKTMKAFAWVYVPSVPGFDDLSIRPAFAISAAGTASSFPVAQESMMPGQWNLVETEDLTFPGGWGSGDDRLQYQFYVNATNTNVPDGSYYIIVDSIYLVDTNCNIRDIMNGRYRPSAKYTGISTDGDHLTIRSSTYHALSAPHITLGQGEVTVMRPFPVAGGDVGFGLTTGGVLGSTAVFKSIGTYAA